MNLKNSIFLFGWLITMLFNIPAFAQDSSYNLIKKELTKEQRALLQKERDYLQSSRD